MIDGVKLKELKPIPDERGRLMEILRCDDDIFKEFGQVYITTIYPGAVKAWHYHKKQTDSIAVISGMVKIAIYDSREESTTRGNLKEIFAGNHNPVLVQIPPRVYHGLKGIGEEETVVVNVPDYPYDSDSPDEYRIDPHENDIPYDWGREDK